MKNSIVNNHDLNGFEVNLNGASPYKGVYFRESTGLFGVSVSLINDENPSFESRSLMVSINACPLEAAFYYKEFIKDRQKNIEELETVGSNNWHPVKSTPEFEFESLDERVATGNITKSRTKSVRSKKLDLYKLFLDKNKHNLLSKITISGKEAFHTILKERNLSLKDLSKQSKDLAKEIFIKEEINALTAFNELSIII